MTVLDDANTSLSGLPGQHSPSPLPSTQAGTCSGSKSCEALLVYSIWKQELRKCHFNFSAVPKYPRALVYVRMLICMNVCMYECMYESEGSPARWTAIRCPPSLLPLDIINMSTKARRLRHPDSPVKQFTHTTPPSICCPILTRDPRFKY